MYFMEDEQLARRLQNEFNSTQNFKYRSETSSKENQNPVDSLLEYNDPTPSIHDLFVKFDKKFFWSSLGMVQVMWSNRMTSCAGVCSFSPKQRHCKISLSAPLLSLRPRKDLVETLLHEMIHAYLFITNNFRDRDDHGPEFHKHMFRINKEAGTKITVYHTFLDEVEYYQRHIWRCNGPCQNKKPYFGFVRRAMNRAPGPNDKWWNDHKRECNGTFIKISEPEKPVKGKKGKEIDPGKKGKDIRQFFTPQNSKQPNQSFSGVKKSNIMTFADLKSDKPACGLKTNANTGTLVVTKKDQSNSTNSKPKSNDNKPRKSIQNVSKTSKQSDKCKDGISKSGKTNGDVRDFVRNVWANKFPSKTSTSDSNSQALSPKKIKLQSPECSESFHKLNITSQKNLTEEQPKNELETVKVDEFKLCPVCSKKILQSEMNSHLESCLSCNFVIDEENEVQCESYPCPCCYKWFSESEMNNHIDECLTIMALKEEFSNS